MTIRSATSRRTNPGRALLALVGLFVACQTWALQVKDASVEGGTIVAQISAKDPSRIVVDGAPIRAATADDDSLVIHRDPQDPQGHIFVKPRDPKKFSTLFISTDSGAYSLLLKPADIPGETVIIREKHRGSDLSRVDQATTRVRAAKSLILAMARNDPGDMEVHESGREFALWKECRFVLSRSWLAHSLVGEQWRLANVSRTRMVLADQEFFKDGVLAVAIDALNLDPGQATNVYVVRARGESDE